MEPQQKPKPILRRFPHKIRVSKLEGLQFGRLWPLPTGAHEKRPSFSQLTEELPRPGHLRVSVPRTLTKSTLLSYLSRKCCQLSLDPSLTKWCWVVCINIKFWLNLYCWSVGPVPPPGPPDSSGRRDSRASRASRDPRAALASQANHEGGTPVLLSQEIGNLLRTNYNTATRDAGYTDVEWVFRPSYNWGVPLICRAPFSILFVQFR